MQDGEKLFLAKKSELSIPTTNSININYFYIPSSHEKINKYSFDYITLNHEQEKIKTLVYI